MKLTRINKYLADAGICSRRKAEDLIREGRVKINGHPVSELSLKVDEDTDAVTLDGTPVSRKKNKIYVILNKPEKVISTASDEFDRKTVMDYVREVGHRLHYAGRLDSDTSGLVLLTNDGEISQKLTHPRKKIKKTYTAELKGVPSAGTLKLFSRGLIIDDYKTAPAQIRILRTFHESSEVEIKITEGKKRQIRKMCKEINHPVITLKRTAVGEISMGRLKEGTYRHLRKDETDYLKSL